MGRNFDTVMQRPLRYASRHHITGFSIKQTKCAAQLIIIWFISSQMQSIIRHRKSFQFKYSMPLTVGVRVDNSSREHYVVNFCV